METTVAVKMDIPKNVATAMELVGFSGDRLEQEMREVTAMDLFKKRFLSIGKASELAGMCLSDFMDLLVRNEIPVTEYTLNDYKKDVEAFKKLEGMENR